MRTADSVPVTEPAAGADVQRSRLWPWRACAILAAVLLFIGSLQAWAYPNITDTSRFVETTGEALQREDVREALATRVVDGLLQDYPIMLATVRDTMIATVTGLLGSETFEALFTTVATQLQRALVHGEQLGISIESRELQVSVLAIARVLDPEGSRNLALEDGVLQIELFSDRDIPSFESELTNLRWAGIAAGLVGLFLLVVPFVRRRDRWSVRLAGLVLMGVALATFLTVLLANRYIDLRVSDSQANTVINGIADGFFGWLIAQTVIVLLIGVVLCVLGIVRMPSWKRQALQPA